MTITTQISQLCCKKMDAQVLWGMQWVFIPFSYKIDQKFTYKTVLAWYCLKLSLPIFLKRFLIFAQFQPHVSYRHVSYLKNV